MFPVVVISLGGQFGMLGPPKCPFLIANISIQDRKPQISPFFGGFPPRYTPITTITMVYMHSPVPTICTDLTMQKNSPKCSSLMPNMSIHAKNGQMGLIWGGTRLCTLDHIRPQKRDPPYCPKLVKGIHAQNC